MDNSPAEDGTPQPLRGSFALRISLAGLALATAFLLMLGGATYSVLRTEIHAGLARMLDREARAAADEVAEGLRNVSRKLDDIAENPIVANALADTGGRAPYVTEFFAGFATIGSMPVTVALADFTGRVTVSSGARGIVDSLEPRIAEAIERRLPASLIAQTDQFPALVLVKPVFIARTGSVEGAVVASIPVDRLLPLNWIARTSLFTAWVGRRGLRRGWETLGPPFGAAADRPSSGEQRVSALQPLPLDGPLADLNLLLFISAERKNFYAPLDRLTVLFTGLGAAMAVIVVGFCFWGARRLCAPLRDLERAAHAVVGTQSFGQRVTVHGHDEVARLGAAFNRMLARLEEDVVRRRASETALRESEARFRALIENAPAGVFLQDLDGRYLIVNEEFAQIHSTTPQEMIGRTLEHFVVPEFAARANGYMRLMLKTGQRHVHETSVPGPDGTTRHLLATRFPIPGDEEESFIGFGGILTDISEYKALQNQLAQAQKTETIGQLTWGIAHDFNNLLTVILGNSESLVESLGTDSPLVLLAERNVVAAQRAAELTEQLLAYARQQQLEMKTFDANALIVGLQNLLRRTLEESIRLDTDLASDLWPVAADPTRLETALLNLVLNARDAMPNGGRVLIRSSNAALDEAYTRYRDGLRVGDYVKIAVEDTGCGMSPEVAAKVFDPFFTTKEVGKGTGLGLSMVYGFANQSGGHVNIYSEPGHGTVVTLYLPRSSAGEVGSDGPEKGTVEMTTGAGETVLVVEDHDLVREHISGQLERLGYLVVAAANGQAALEIIEGETPVDLVFTDLVMPGGLDGVELAAMIRRQRPDLPVLLTSGYDQGRLSKGDVEANNTKLLQKPYTAATLARSIRDALSSGQERSPAATAPR